jgi:hypothetical protein
MQQVVPAAPDADLHRLHQASAGRHSIARLIVHVSRPQTCRTVVCVAGSADLPPAITADEILDCARESAALIAVHFFRFPVSAPHCRRKLLACQRFCRENAPGARCHGDYACAQRHVSRMPTNPHFGLRRGRMVTGFGAPAYRSQAIRVSDTDARKLGPAQACPPQAGPDASGSPFFRPS